MKLKGTVEIEEADYRKSLELAFTDYLEEDTRTPKLFRNCVIDRLIGDQILLQMKKLLHKQQMMQRDS